MSHREPRKPENQGFPCFLNAYFIFYRLINVKLISNKDFNSFPGSYNAKEFNHHIHAPMPSSVTSESLDNSFKLTIGSDHTTLFLTPSDKEVAYTNEGENIFYGRSVEENRKRRVVFRPEYKKTIVSNVRNIFE